jgi:L-ascorbate metabolism protein UlaG (beta-lactamase superfamily)
MTDELTFIGTATTLLRLGPFTLLTDPNFLHAGERAYLGYGLWSKRRTDPAIEVADLPELDAIVLSHRHGDHWDRQASRRLDHNLPVVTTTHAALNLRRKDKFRNAVGLRRWKEFRLDKDGWQLTIQSLPGAHSRNPLLRVALPPVMGSMLTLTDPTGEPLRRVYLTGDTMPFGGMDEIARRHPDIDTTVVHAGGTRLLGMFVVTMTGDHVVDCLRRIRPRAAVPVHYDDYGVFKSGLDDVKRAVAAADLPVEMRYVARGDTVSLA